MAVAALKRGSMEERRLNFFEKYLTLWAIGCIGLGILLGKLFPLVPGLIWLPVLEVVLHSTHREKWEVLFCIARGGYRECNLSGGRKNIFLRPVLRNNGDRVIVYSIT